MKEANKEKEKEEKESDVVNLDRVNKFKRNGGIGDNIIMLSKMAYYLVSKGHNTELFNPFKYPILKLSKTYRLVTLNDLSDKNEVMFGTLSAIAGAFGDRDAIEIFENQIKKIEEIV